jgi:glycerol-3-phosphate acyltransferase PlsY
VETLAVAVLSYLLGAISSGYIVGKLRGVDLRAEGSGNLGFTNVLRVLGPRAAVPVLVIDVAKGAAAVLLISRLAGAEPALGPTGIRLLAGVCAVAGNLRPIFTRFRGGKGVATACGVFLALAPAATAAVVVVWLLLVFTTRYVSVGSITAAVLLPFGVAIEVRAAQTAQPVALMVAAVLVAVAVVVHHRTNIRRLIEGTENRFGRSRE